MAPLTASDRATCHICHRSFTRQSVLNVHMQMVHTNLSVRKSRPNFGVATNVDGSVEEFLDGESFVDDD